MVVYDDNEQQINTAPVNSFGYLKVNVFTANRALMLRLWYIKVWRKVSRICWRCCKRIAAGRLK